MTIVISIERRPDLSLYPPSVLCVTLRVVQNSQLLERKMCACNVGGACQQA